MKVLHIINNLGAGGAEKLLEESLPIMAQKKGVDVSLLLLTDANNVFDKKLYEKNIKVNIVPFRKPHSPMNIFYIRKYLIEGNYDVVHVHLFPCQYWVAAASKLIFRKEMKFVTTEHNTYNRRRDYPFLKYIDRFMYSSYHKIISISDDTQRNLVTWLKITSEQKDKFKVVSNGININRFKNAKPYEKGQINAGFSEDTKLLCMIGRFTQQKDQKTIIEAMKRLPENVNLLLIGEGELLEQNKQLCRRIGVEDRVHFLRFRNDVERIFQAVDIVVLSSHWEGFGLVAVEGMAAAKPVIASNVPGLSNVVDGAGVLFETGNSVQLANIVSTLLSDKSKYKQVSEACFKRAFNYSIEEMVENYLVIYAQ